MNSAYKKSRTVPSRLPTLSFDRKYHKRRFVINEKRATLEKALMLMVKVDATKVIPRINVIFMKQLPMILPNASSKCPFLTAPILVDNSGTLVPKATTVAPMTTGGMPTLSARIDDDSTIKLAQITTPIAPRTVKAMYLFSLPFSVLEIDCSVGVRDFES